MFKQSLRSLFVLAICLYFSGNAGSAFAQSPGVIQFFAGGKMQKGVALVDLANEIVVVGRDGWMRSIDPRDPDNRITRIDEPYEPARAVEMRNGLRAEFGPRFEVRSTKNFLVVQPKGRGDRWPTMFEQSHRSFVAYMKKLGVKVRQGRFPMVAVVLPDERAMYREFKRLDIDVKRVAGLYSGESNRVMTHDGGQLSMIAATVRHEAAHQSAFNTGVHSRVNDTPRWITEGIGQMFEPRAMTKGRGGSQLADRVNRESNVFIKNKYRDRHDTRFSESVMQLISDDTMFENSKQVEEAYAVAWSMMFYLAERNPKVFAKLLNYTSSRPPFKEYSRTRRVKDFEKIVGVDTYEFSKRLSWYLAKL